MAVDFYELQLGLITPSALNPSAAITYLNEQSRSRYAPTILDSLVEALDKTHHTPTRNQVSIPLHMLSPGMEIAQNLLNSEHFLLLAKEQIIDNTIIDTSFINKLA